MIDEPSPSPSLVPAGVREHPAHPLDDADVPQTSATPPPRLPQGEREASRSAQDARQYDRLRWRCRRGLLELDVVLKDFLDSRYPKLTPTEKEAFEKLLTTSDETLLAYVQGKQNPPEKELMQLIAKLRE